MKKLTAILSLMAVSSLVSSSVVFAENNVSTNSSKEKIVTVAETKEVSYEVLNLKGKAEKIKNEIKVDLDSKLEKLNNKVVVPEKKALKEKLLKHYRKNADRQAENIKNIDNIVDEYINYFENLKDNDLVAQDFRLYPHTHYWSVAPYKTSNSHHIAYSTSWVGIDCYRSSVEGQKTKTEEKSISYTLGLNGSAEIKSWLDLTANWEKSKTHTISIEAGTTCPAWNVVWWRPYARYEKDSYEGCYGTEYYNLNGDLVTVTEKKTLTNKISKDELTEFANKVNTKKSTTASTPSAPTGAPNAWW